MGQETIKIHLNQEQAKPYTELILNITYYH